MSTFYVLPPRECLEQAVADFLGRILPGLTVPETLAEELLARMAESTPDLFLLHREDLPGGPLVGDLVESFGAEPGDRVVEVPLAIGNRPTAVRSWVVPTAVPESAVDC